MLFYLVTESGADINRVFRLADDGVYRIGRGDRADICLLDQTVSRRHAEVFLENGRAWVREKGSRNGTFLEGQRLDEAEKPREVALHVPLRFGMVICRLMPSSPISEEAWSTLTDVGSLQRYLPGRGGARKLRLFICACCRMLSSLLPQPLCLDIVKLAEGFADEQKTYPDLDCARGQVNQHSTEWGGEPDANVAFEILQAMVEWSASLGVQHVLPHLPTIEAWFRLKSEDLIRDLLGDFFHPIPCEESWLTWNDGLLHRMARGIYASGRFGDMPILADALEEAGCREECLLQHLRKQSFHVRGCWALDALLAPANSP